MPSSPFLNSRNPELSLYFVIVDVPIEIQVELVIEFPQFIIHLSDDAYCRFGILDPQHVVGLGSNRVGGSGLWMAETQELGFGIPPSEEPFTFQMVHFDIPGVAQLSWKTAPPEGTPPYVGEWDGKDLSNFPKIERAVEEHYPHILE